jgi:secreted trypsin-like serine protease
MCENTLFESSQVISSEPIELDGVHAAAIKLLPQGTPVVAGTPTQVSGWATKRKSSGSSDVLLKADVPIIDYAQCQNLYDGGILYNEICAGPADDLWDLCEGDEGSGLVYNGTLVGVATWGTICGVRNTPGVYTNAARYTDWIESKIGVKQTHV